MHKVPRTGPWLSGKTRRDEVINSSFPMAASIVKITRESSIPLIGCIAFGIIDRGTSVLQVRAWSGCNMNCAFCSTDGGPSSKFHATTYIVDLDYLIEEVEKVVGFKGEGIEINIDSVGEPSGYPEIFSLISQVKLIPGVARISMQTNGTLLTPDRVTRFIAAGLHEVHLSLHSLHDEKAKMLFGMSSYQVKVPLAAIDQFLSRGVEIKITPVWIPGSNDEDIEELIMFAKQKGIVIAIQKYEEYKFSRRMKGIKQLTYWKFYKQLEVWEKKYEMALIYKKMKNTYLPRPRLPKPFVKGDKIRAVIKAPGWILDQMLGVADGRCVSITGCQAGIGESVRVKITEDGNNLFYGTAL
ncbi:MAG: hypothetical protein QS99_C0016G0054 [archaeon GW2011_AR4]|nr:MAG: hypothetical protein QS99_C0016G0054 [archaeon GW2011_AR4]